MPILQEFIAAQKNTEASPHLYRWAFLACVGAALSRNCWVCLGNKYIYANMYVLFVGMPASKKTSAILSAKGLLSGSGFGNFAYGSTSMEQFVADFENINLPKKFNGEVDFDAALSTDFASMTSTNVFVAEDEMANFLGAGNTRFIKVLTELWDNPPFKDFRYKNSKHIHVDKPTVSMLGGFTPTAFIESVPQESSGNGFLSRCILVYAPPTEKKITWPTPLSQEQKEEYYKVFEKLRNLKGHAEISPDGLQAIDEIYQSWESLDDVRLQYYCGRRLEHLLKLCLAVGALKAVECGCVSIEITTDVILEANTILTYTEEYMSMALGELGKSKNSDASQKIIEKLAMTSEPIALTDLWVSVSQDLDKVSQLHDIINKLKLADKVVITTTNNSSGMPISKVSLKRKLRNDKLPWVSFAQFVPEASKGKLKIV